MNFFWFCYKTALRTRVKRITEHKTDLQGKQETTKHENSFHGLDSICLIVLSQHDRSTRWPTPILDSLMNDLV